MDERDWTVHPGETLAETLASLGMSQVELARRTGLTTKHINRIVKGHASYSSAVAVKFEDATGISARFWMGLMAGYEIDLLRGRRLAGSCPIRSSVTDEQCLLPEGHPMWDVRRFHKYPAPP